MKLNILFIFLAFFLFTLPGSTMEPDQPTEEKIDQLLKTMTLKEKIGQMIQISIGAVTKPHPPLPNKKTTFIKKKDDLHLFWGGGNGGFNPDLGSVTQHS